MIYKAWIYHHPLFKTGSGLDFLDQSSGTVPHPLRPALLRGIFFEKLLRGVFFKKLLRGIFFGKLQKAYGIHPPIWLEVSGVPNSRRLMGSTL